MMNNTLEKAIRAIKSGDKETGRQLLAQFLKAHPQSELGWLWMSNVVDNDKHRRYSLDQVLKINPDNETAHRGIAILEQRKENRLQQTKAKEQEENLSSTHLSASSSIVPESTTVDQTLQSKISLEQPQINNLQSTVDDDLVTIHSPSLIKKPSLLKQSKIDTPEPTKSCPYCAETIKAEATVCRYCGTNLSQESQVAQVGMDRALLDREIARLTAKSWLLVSRTETSAHLRLPKRWSRLLLILGALFLLFFGAGLAFWLWALIDYMLKKEKTKYITIEQLRAKQKPLVKPVPNTNAKERTRKKGKLSLVFVVAIIGMIMVLCVGGSVLSLMTQSTNTTGNAPVVTKSSETVPTETAKPEIPEDVKIYIRSMRADVSVIGSEIQELAYTLSTLYLRE